MANQRLDRTRSELADFLRTKRESLSPLEVGLPRGSRRRTPGLRREEVAALAGVGLTWYMWLEQGREINASAAFLENVARVLKLDEIERRHLFLLARKCPPVSNGRPWDSVSPLVRRLLDDLVLRPAYVFNLRRDVIAWNVAAETLFAFEDRDVSERNMLWMLFSDDRLHGRMAEWEKQAPQILASFRCDYAQAPEDEAMNDLVMSLEASSPLFKMLWTQHDVHGRCQGRRNFEIDGVGMVAFEHQTLVVDADRHLRMAFYATIPDQPNGARFDDLCLRRPIKK
jgi:transcriptional regulator with XRE-family HTH domain